MAQSIPLLWLYQAESPNGNCMLSVLATDVPANRGIFISHMDALLMQIPSSPKLEPTVGQVSPGTKQLAWPYPQAAAKYFVQSGLRYKVRYL